VLAEAAQLHGGGLLYDQLCMVKDMSPNYPEACIAHWTMRLLLLVCADAQADEG
jgi:hypothetical protein